MAVQAQQPSNAFCSDYPTSRAAPMGSVLNGIPAMQSRQLQIECFPAVPKSAAGLPKASVFSDNPRSELTCNVSGSRKRSRDEQLTLTATPPALHGASFAFENGSPVPVASALLASREQSLRAFDSAVASTSGRPSGFSFQHASTPFSFRQEILAQIWHHNFEMEEFIRFQNERARLGIEEARRRHCKSLLLNLEQLVVKRVREKETELEDANRKNAELEEKIQQMSAESAIWFNVAMNNEAIVSNLKKDLEQIMLQNSIAAAAVPPLKEGYGDSDGTPLPVEDEESFLFNGEALPPSAAPAVYFPETESSLLEMNCKVCGVDDASILILPCRHLCLCLNCEAMVAICPICSNLKNACLQIFIS